MKTFSKLWRAKGILCFLYLEDILVTEKARGKGIGKLLMDTLIEEAKEKKFSGMMWQVLDWNTPAVDFYKKLGASIEAEWWDCKMTEKQIEEYKSIHVEN